MEPDTTPLYGFGGKVVLVVNDSQDTEISVPAPSDSSEKEG